MLPRLKNRGRTPDSWIAGGREETGEECGLGRCVPQSRGPRSRLGAVRADKRRTR